MAERKTESTGESGGAGYRSFYEDNYGFLLRVAYRYCDRYEEAVEATHQGMLAVFRELQQLSIKNIGKEQWVLDWMKEQVIIQSLERTITGTGRPAIQMNDRLPLADQGSPDHRRLIELLRRLPREQRLAYNLMVLDDYTLAQVAALLTLDERAIMKLITAAREQLGKWLGGQATEALRHGG